MKWSFATVGLVAAGFVGVMIILLFQNLTVNNEEDYYLLKEITEAAMTESIDLAYYRDTGKLKMIQEKFVENFTRRFAESANILNTQNYSIEFFDIMEQPPKASVRITTDIGEYTILGNHLDPQSYSVSNNLDAIIETDEIPDNIVPINKCDRKVEYISSPYARAGNQVYNHPGAYISKPNDTDDWELTDYYVTSIVLTSTDVKEYRDKRDEWYPDYQETGYESLEETDSKYIAINQKVEQFSIDQVGDKYHMKYRLAYDCREGKRLVTSNGVTRDNNCLIGVKYTVNWHNKSCDE